MKVAQLLLSVFLVILAACAVCLSVYGVFLAFSASIFLGILVLFLEPAPLVIGAAAFFFNTDIPQRLLELF